MARLPGRKPVSQQDRLLPHFGNLPQRAHRSNVPIDPKATYVANWNVTYQRQLPGNWLVSASYLGNHTTHLWSDRGEANPAVYIPGNCAAGQYGLTAPGPCFITSNTPFRRRLHLANPTLGAAYASINTMDDGAVAHYTTACCYRCSIA